MMIYFPKTTVSIGGKGIKRKKKKSGPHMYETNMKSLSNPLSVFATTNIFSSSSFRALYHRFYVISFRGFTLGFNSHLCLMSNVLCTECVMCMSLSSDIFPDFLF